MKKLKLMFVLFAATALISSCKKNDTTPNCNTVCQNGGTVDANCGCDCPSGFTGANCQTIVNSVTFYPVTVNVNSNSYHQLCPNWYSGDDDFGGCLSIPWSVNLFITSSDTKIYAKVYANYIECSNTGYTAAKVDPNLSSNQILLYTAPFGKRIYSINCGCSNSGTVYPNLNQHGTMTLVNTNTNSYLNKMEFIGDTSGPDLPCDGSSERSRFRVYFKSFDITLINQ
ncbi:hypothetical protein BH11BAC1_BH11BAC1_00060 [soil metagenome]